MEDNETPTNDLSGFGHPKYSQNDLLSNRKRLFDTSDLLETETHKKQPPVRSTSYSKIDNSSICFQDDHFASPKEYRKYAGSQHSVDHQHQESDLCNFQSFSKNYVTFDKQQNPDENKENMGYNHNKGSKKASRPPQPPQPEPMNLPKGTYADRYLLMMKKRRDGSVSKQTGDPKSGKKQSMFDEIRHQAISKVQNRHY